MTRRSSPGPPDHPELHNLSSLLRPKLFIIMAYLLLLEALFILIYFTHCCPNPIKFPSPKTVSQQLPEAFRVKFNSSP